MSRPRRRSASAAAPSRAGTFQIDDGSLFVLYTDGLVENRGQDIDDGLNRLRGVFGPGSTQAAARGSVQGHPRRRLRRPPARRHRGAAGQAQPDPGRASCLLDAAGRADLGAAGPRPGQRSRWISGTWATLAYTTELLVSELVTNALAYATGEVSLRLILDRALVCEVFDDAAAMPKLQERRRQRRERPRAARGEPAGAALGNAADPGRQGRLVRAGAARGTTTDCTATQRQNAKRPR